jgi:hypothetical protein
MGLHLSMPRLGSPAVPEVGAGNLLQNVPVDSIKSIRDPFLSGDYVLSVVGHCYSELAQTPPVVWVRHSKIDLVRCCSELGRNDD